ncbi:MAG TPA: MFS transporter [Candidatus Paceibacterota bacterium]
MTDSQKWWALVFLVLAQFMIVLDVSILNVALPSIERQFSLTVSDLQWMVTAYTLCFGGFLLLGGRAADLYGRKRVFISGVIGFTVISLLIGIVDSASFMVPLRALQGLSAAFMSPSALSIILTLFHEQRERTKALSIWGVVSAGGATAGLLLGGLLTTYLNWRWNFFVNVPVGIVVIIAALRLLPAREQEESDKTLDLPGAVLITSALLLLVYTLSQANTWGWTSGPTFVLLMCAFFLLGGFFINEARAAHPLTPLSIFKIGNVVAADLVQLPITASMFSMFFFLTLYVQNILHYSPLQAGLAFVPSSIMIGISATLAPRLIARIGYKPILVIAPLFLVGGLFSFTQLAADGTYFDFLPGLLLMAVGLGSCFVAIAVAATSGIPGAQSGLASGLLNTAQQIGGSLGLAILSSVAAATTAGALVATQDDKVGALLSGFHSAFYTGMAFGLTASFLAFLLIKQTKVSPVQIPPSA